METADRTETEVATAADDQKVIGVRKAADQRKDDLAMVLRVENVPLKKMPHLRNRQRIRLSEITPGLCEAWI